MPRYTPLCLQAAATLRALWCGMPTLPHPHTAPDFPLQSSMVAIARCMDLAEAGHLHPGNVDDIDARYLDPIHHAGLMLLWPGEEGRIWPSRRGEIFRAAIRTSGAFAIAFGRSSPPQELTNGSVQQLYAIFREDLNQPDELARLTKRLRTLQPIDGYQQRKARRFAKMQANAAFR